jgi:hypothetical protein
MAACAGPSASGGRRRAAHTEALSKPMACGAVPARPRSAPWPEVALYLIEPVGVRLHDSARQAVVEQQITLAVRDRARHRLGDVKAGQQVGDLVPERAQALEHGFFAGDIGREQPPRGLHLDAREASGLAHPVPQRLPPLIRERVPPTATSSASSGPSASRRSGPSCPSPRRRPAPSRPRPWRPPAASTGSSSWARRFSERQRSQGKRQGARDPRRRAVAPRARFAPRASTSTSVAAAPRPDDEENSWASPSETPNAEAGLRRPGERVGAACAVRAGARRTPAFPARRASRRRRREPCKAREAGVARVPRTALAVRPERASGGRRPRRSRIAASRSAIHMSAATRR